MEGVILELVRWTPLFSTTLTWDRKDAILEHFELDRLDFRPYYEDKWLRIDYLPDPKEPRQRRRALGYIKYEKKADWVILVNSCAQIQPEVLQLSHISK